MVSKDLADLPEVFVWVGGLDVLPLFSGVQRVGIQWLLWRLVLTLIPVGSTGVFGVRLLVVLRSLVLLFFVLSLLSLWILLVVLLDCLAISQKNMSVKKAQTS